MAKSIRKKKPATKKSVNKKVVAKKKTVTKKKVAAKKKSTTKLRPQKVKAKKPLAKKAAAPPINLAKDPNCICRTLDGDEYNCYKWVDGGLEFISGPYSSKAECENNCGI